MTVKTLICPADGRETTTLTGSQAGIYPGSSVAFTGYLGVASSGNGDAAGNNGVLFWQSQVKLLDITDGTSNTFMVGERPPSADLQYGWWFAGAGWNQGEGDVVLGARAVNYANSLGCTGANQKLGIQPGTIFNACDQTHWWSNHTGGTNFLMGDASARFVSYSANNVLPQLCSRNGGEVVGDY